MIKKHNVWRRIRGTIQHVMDVRKSDRGFYAYTLCRKSDPSPFTNDMPVHRPLHRLRFIIWLRL
jgi:hypothetical protein